MHHVVTTVPFYRDRTLVPGYDVGGKTGTAQIWDRRRTRRGAGSTTSSTTRSSATSAARRAMPDLIVAVRIEEGTRPIARVGQLRCPVDVVRAVPARSRPTRSRPRTSLPARPSTAPPTPRPAMTRCLCDTSTRDSIGRSSPPAARVRRADSERGPPPFSPPTTSARLTGGRLLAPIRRARSAAGRSILAGRRPGKLFVALPGRADRRPRVPARRGSRPAPRPSSCRDAGRRRDPRRSATSRVVQVAGRRSSRSGAVAAGWRPGSTRWSSGSPAASPRPRRRRPSRPSSARRFRRSRARATRTTRSGCR